MKTKPLEDYEHDGGGAPVIEFGLHCEDDSQLETWGALPADERYPPMQKHTPRPWYDPTEVF